MKPVYFLLFASSFLLPSFVAAKDKAPAEDALAALSSMGDSPVWSFRRSALLARSKLDQGRPKEALHLLENLPPPPRNLLNKNQNFYRRLYRDALETGRLAADRTGQSGETWERRLWAYFPDFESALSAGGGGFPGGVRTEDKIARLHILFEKSLFETIPLLVSPGEIAGAVLPSEDKCRALFEWGYAQQKLRRKNEALEAYGRMEGSSCGGKTLERALYWKGSLETDLKNRDAAEDTFKRLAKISSAGSGRYEDDAYDRLYRIYRSRRQDEKAERALKKLTDLPQGDRKEKHFWDEGFAAYQRRDYKKAMDLFDRIIETKSLGTEAQPQALYWKARTQEILNRPSAATYRRILKTYPFSFYAVLAEARSGEPADVPSIAGAHPEFPADGDLADAFRVVDQLNRRDRHQDAADLLDYLTHLYPSAVREKPEMVAHRWMESGDFNRALELAAEHLDKSVFDINLEAHPLTRAMYPPAFTQDARRAAETNRLPLALILGLMREESLFLRDVRSHAGAVGLMQLMPATARMKARSLGVPHSYADLSDPSSNIELGSSYLKDMLGRFDGQTALAVMAYNAGPGNVSKWLRNRGNLPLDEFIESTPLDETRGYVKRVLRSAHIYGHLLGQPQLTWAFKSLDDPPL